MALQTDLTNSEEVQRDFVRLSQSLQRELERIRESGTLVIFIYPIISIVTLNTFVYMCIFRFGGNTKKILSTVVIVAPFFQTLKFEKYICIIFINYSLLKLILFFRTIVDIVVEYFAHLVCLEL